MPIANPDVRDTDCSDINTYEHTGSYTKPDPNGHTNPYTNRDAHWYPNADADQ